MKVPLESLPKIEKMKKEILKDAPKLRGYTQKEVEEKAKEIGLHIGSKCPVTGNSYKELPGNSVRVNYEACSGGSGYQTICSECGKPTGFIRWFKRY
jgi:hypothetical protein